jgi:Tfp pilus assembly protein PilZ
MTAERRRSARRSFEGAVDVLEEVHGRRTRALGGDVSAVGMFLATVADYRVGETVTVRFSLPESHAEVELHARVVRVIEPGGGEASPGGVALEFLDAPAWAVDEVVRYTHGFAASATVTSRPG